MQVLCPALLLCVCAGFRFCPAESLGALGRIYQLSASMPRARRADLRFWLTVLRRQLTDLKDLTISQDWGTSLPIQLPPQLEHLKVFGGISSVNGHRDLQYVELDVVHPTELGLLKQLGTLPKEWALQLKLAAGSDILPSNTAQEQDFLQQVI